MEGRREPQDHTPFSEEGCRRGETGQEAGRARTRDREGLCVEGKSVCGGQEGRHRGQTAGRMGGAGRDWREDAPDPGVGGSQTERDASVSAFFMKSQGHLHHLARGRRPPAP